MDTNFGYESDAVKNTIGLLRLSGMIIERVGEDMYNVISTATGAVLARLIPSSELGSYARCMSYVAIKHGDAVKKTYTYTKPVHNTMKHGLKGINRQIGV